MQPSAATSLRPQLERELRAAPTKSWKQEDKPRANRTMGNSEQKKVANTSLCLWNEAATPAGSAPVHGCF